MFFYITFNPARAHLLHTNGFKYFYQTQIILFNIINYLHRVKWFQVFLSKTNNSQYYLLESCLYTHKYIYIYIYIYIYMI